MEEKTIRFIGNIKNIFVPIVTAIVVSVVAFSELQSRIDAHDVELNKIGTRISVLEQTSANILQRLASIDTKLDYITKSLDKLTK